MTTKRAAGSATKLRPRLTDSQKQEIGEKLQQGIAVAELAEQYGKSVQTISNLRSTGGSSVQAQPSRQTSDSKLKSRLLQFAVAILKPFPKVRRASLRSWCSKA